MNKDLADEPDTVWFNALTELRHPMIFSLTGFPGIQPHHDDIFCTSCHFHMDMDHSYQGYVALYS